MTGKKITPKATLIDNSQGAQEIKGVTSEKLPVKISFSVQSAGSVFLFENGEVELKIDSTNILPRGYIAENGGFAGYAPINYRVPAGEVLLIVEEFLSEN